MTYVRKTHRFGLITPSSNTTQEIEYWRFLPDDVSLHVARLPLRRVEALADPLAQALALDQLEDEDVLVLVDDQARDAVRLAEADPEGAGVPEPAAARGQGPAEPASAASVP